MSLNPAEAFQHFERLKQEQEFHLRSCEERIEKWEKFKNDYIALKNRLETLPNELKYDIMVPVSKVGFMTGKLVHTNEILVLLGDNWFVEKSAKQACELVDRRLTGVNEFLNKLFVEKKSFTENVKWTKDVMNEKSEFINIEEKIDEVPKNTNSIATNNTTLTTNTKKTMTEEEKKDLRKKLQEKALRIQAELDVNLKKTNKSASIEKDSDDDDDSEEESDALKIDESYVEESTRADFIANLENDIKNLDLGKKFETLPTPPLSLTTSSAQTFEEMLQEYEKNIDRKNNEMIEQLLKTRRDSDSKNVKSVKWSDEQQENDEDGRDDEEEEDYDDDENDYDLDSSEENKENQEVSQAKVIRISHTKSEKIEEKLRNLKVSRVKPELNSPGDIYTVFYKPKSILKPSVTSQLEDENSQIETKQEIPVKSEVKNAEYEKFEPQKAFTGTIVEKSFVNMTKNEQDLDQDQMPKKPISKFKASRKN